MPLSLTETQAALALDHDGAPGLGGRGGAPEARAENCFDEIALVGDTDRTATVTADDDLRCYGLTSWAFRPIVEENASVAWKLLQSMGKLLCDRQRD